jgi:hypothetical protein
VGRCVLAQDRNFPRAIRAVKRMGDPRADELGHLKLALAAFALHLEALEMLTQEVMQSAGRSEDRGPFEIGHGHKSGLSGKDQARIT